MNKPMFPAVILGLILAGCGSDSSEEPVEPPIVSPPTDITYDNFDLKIELNDPLEGQVSFYIGRWYPCSDSHPEFCDANNLNKFTPDRKRHEMTIKVADLQRELGRSINKQMAEGQFTILDLMLYVSKVRDDFEITMSEFDESIGSYRFTTSFDSNGDNKFSVEDGEENYKNPHWYPRFTYTAGDFKREVGPPTLEAIYERPEEFILRPNTEIRYEPFTPLMTARRDYVQAKEVQRLKEHQGKVVIEELQVDKGDGNGYVTIAEDIEVKNFNLRPDLFADGVYTIADAMMTAHQDENHNVDIGFTVWPTLSTNSNVDAYSVTRVQGQRANGFNGWLLYTGELESSADFFTGDVSVDQVIANRDRYCSWIEDITPVEAQQCLDDFNNGTVAAFGGNMLHQMTDAWIINYPHEVVQFKWSRQNSLWQTQEFHYADGQYDWYDITKAVAPMDEEHFGWGIADCSQCHSIDNVHLSGDSPILPNTAEPYYCAQCHGSNGAPMGHGEEARCHWCHTKDKQMANHGKASLTMQAAAIECRDDITDEQGNPVNGPCANANKKGMAVHDKANNYGPHYPGNMSVTNNSDWHMDSQFPDPYSCVTCHPNPQMESATSAN